MPGVRRDGARLSAAGADALVSEPFAETEHGLAPPGQKRTPRTNLELYRAEIGRIWWWGAVWGKRLEESPRRRRPPWYSLLRRRRGLGARWRWVLWRQIGRASCREGV